MSERPSKDAGQESEVNIGRLLQSMKKQREVECATCGAEFWATDSRAKYCSATCRSTGRRMKVAQWSDKKCEACGVTMFTHDKRLKYCSASCRKAASSLRN